jgi:DNA-binding SARP family transcriptional activator
MGAGVDVRILGPLEIGIDGRDLVELRGWGPRTLLALLALNANAVISADHLVEQLWAEPPATAAHGLQVFVSRLRGALGPASDRILTKPPGYVLALQDEELDAQRCEELCARGRACLAGGEALAAAALLREAESLWRGPPLADFTYADFAQPAIARLDELRFSCREELIDAELALGRHVEVVSDLDGFVRAHPFRERARGQLMLALYRCGRQADALEAFRQARRALVDELGVEPGSALRELEQAILSQDPALLGPVAAVVVPATISTDVVVAAPPAVARAEPAPGGILRKTATVLAARLEVAAGVDLELAHELVARGREAAELIVGRHGGAALPGMGGDVVAVFGIPVTAEDDAVRALRAAEELRRDVATPDAADLVVRVGIATGEVVARAPGDVLGAPLRQAADLAQAAGAAEVLLSDATHRLASAVIQAEPGPLAATWRFRGADWSLPGVAARSMPMVGRERELGEARSALDRAAEAGRAQLLTLIGEAGIGKSRLAAELIAELAEAATVLTGRCLSYGDGIAYWPLREALARAAGEESTEAIRALLGDADDAPVVAATVAAAVGFADGAGPLGATAAEQIQWAFRRLLELLARERPVLLVIEDVHWGEPPLLELLEYLVDWVTAPVVLFCLSRPELLESRPAWGGGRPSTTSIVLPPLSDDEATRLLSHRLGDAAIEPAALARILLTAEGNPLFVEQLLALSEEDPSWAEAGTLPGTVQNLLAARLDRLDPGERAVMQRAALIGREFWPAAVIALLPEPARQSASGHLRALIRRGFVQPDRSALAGHDQARFNHILIRDVAYGAMPKAVRAELHERFADWLDNTAHGYDEFVGYHLERAFRLGSELWRDEPRLAGLATRAAERLATAGRRALERSDAGAGVSLLRSARALFDQGGSPRPDVLLDLGVALGEHGEFDDAGRALTEALDGARAGGADALEARAMIELSYRRLQVERGAKAQELVPVADQAIAVFDRVGDDAGLSRALLHAAEVQWHECRFTEMEELLGRALRHAERSGDGRAAARILSFLARAVALGAPPVEEAIRRCREILVRVDDDVLVTATVEAMLALLTAMRGEFDAARDRWRATRRRLEDVGLEIHAAHLQGYAAMIDLMAGSPADAYAMWLDSYTVLEQIGNKNRLTTAAGFLARVLCDLERYDESERYCQICAETASSDDVCSQVLWRAARGRGLAHAGDADQALALLDRAVEIAGATDFTMLLADTFSDRAQASAALRRYDDAGRDLTRAIALYEGKGMAAAAANARRTVAALPGTLH